MVVSVVWLSVTGYSCRLKYDTGSTLQAFFEKLEIAHDIDYFFAC